MIQVSSFLAPARKKTVFIAALFSGCLLFILAANAITSLHGLRGRTYDNDSWEGSPVSSATDSVIHFEKKGDAGSPGNPDRFSIVWEGDLYAPKNSSYLFSIVSDDGSWIFLDDALLIDDGGIHPSRLVEKEIPLSKGSHHLLIKYFNAGGPAEVDFRWKETKTPKRLMPKLHLYSKPVSFAVFALDSALPYLMPLSHVALLILGFILLFWAVRAIFPRWEILSVFCLCLFLLLAGYFGFEVLAKRSTAVTGCDSYAYLQGAELMARHGFFHTEFVDPLVPEIYRAYATKPSERQAIFLLSPHGYYVYDLDGGLVYNVFPPGMSILLYPFVKLGGRSPAFFVLPFLILIMVGSFYYWGSKLAGPIFGLCLSAAAVFSGNVFENTIVIMSDVPSMALISLSAFLLYRNIKSPRRIRPFVAGALFGFSLMVRYSNLMGAVPLAFLFWAASRDKPSACHSPVAYIHGRVRRKYSPMVYMAMGEYGGTGSPDKAGAPPPWTPGQNPGPRPPWRHERNGKKIIGGLSLFSAGAILFGILPLAVYTDRLFGTVFRLVYEPFNQSRMAWANIGPGISFYLKSMVQAFGIPGLALMAIGLGACVARRRIRAAGLFCALAFMSFFVFYVFHGIREERYLLPAYPFLAVFYAFGVVEIARKFDKSLLAKILIVMVCACYPLVHSAGSYPLGAVSQEVVSSDIQKKVEPRAVVFCDELSGPLRLYAGLPAYRFIWTDPRTLQETLAFFGLNKFAVYFFLDSSPARERFRALTDQDVIPKGRLDFVSNIRGWPLYRIRP
jgi:nitrogen fixation-related uncharacterized protein